jgi:hypothetical protein
LIIAISFDATPRNLAAKGEEAGEVLNNISTCVILDFKDLGYVHCSQKMMDQMKLYIGTSLDYVVISL